MWVVKNPEVCFKISWSRTFRTFTTSLCIHRGLVISTFWSLSYELNLTLNNSNKYKLTVVLTSQIKTTEPFGKSIGFPIECRYRSQKWTSCEADFRGFTNSYREILELTRFWGFYCNIKIKLKFVKKKYLDFSHLNSVFCAVPE